MPTTSAQVVFLTDGAIGNEQQLFDTISALRGRSRVFMVGIGSAPNTYLMTRAAELGRGTFTHIGSVEQVEERMRGLFAKLESPAVTNLSAKFSDAHGRHHAGRDPRPLSRRAAGAGGKARQARRLGRDQGPHRRPALGRHAAAGQCRRRQGPVQALGAPQDRRCRSRAHHAAGDARRSRQDHPGAGARASARDAADQPRRGRQDAEPSGRRAAEARGTAAQPAGRLGFRKGVRRAAACPVRCRRNGARSRCGAGSGRGAEAGAAGRHARRPTRSRCRRRRPMPS